MADIRPFHGVHYNPALVKDMAEVLCPPYDVITPLMQQELYQQSDANFVRIEYGRELPHDKDTDNKYIRASDTLKKWLEQGTLQIDDKPDFANRGVMLDISRDKVPTMETLYKQIDILAECKINQIQLYTEHTFAYDNHKVVWQNASPMTPEQILDLDQYCRDRHIELVPNQNSFG